MASSQVEGKGMTEADLKGIEESLRKLIAALDKTIRLEALWEEEEGWVAILSKGSHSDRTVLSRQWMESYSASGKHEKELRHALGKVIGKLNRLAQRRR